ncbi:MAG TPA: cytochrome c-type biogenesis CcmF C-terminal domain-containing protein, partial [Chloroflexota bacterium]|nr:cytochrome c-type biogenesis CcmF C-terminal domain-containing protein [Chloroflexota bacterium]
MALAAPAAAALLPSLGRLGVLLALVVSVYAILAAILGQLRQRPALVASARNAVYVVAALLTLAAGALFYALFAHDFSVKYVAEQTTRDMPWFIRLAAFYSGQSGSLLFWAWTLALWSAAAIAWAWRRHAALVPYVTATLAATQAFFAYLLAAFADPFERLSPVPADGRGLNPLLYDSGMLVHPPLQLLGYMASSVPFAIVVAALATGRLDAVWVAAVRRWMLAAWAVLGAGLLLGGWWAYHTLGWGGVWGWDPVENVGLLPWLTMTAYLHSAMVQERRGLLKLWNVSLVLASFALSIFGTLVVRSGILSSVHSFAQSPIGPALFVFLALVAFVSIALIVWRLRQLRDDGAVDALFSRETAFLLNNLILAAVALATLWGTIYPLISESVRGVKVAVGPPFYQQVNGPLLFAMLLLLAAATALSWRRTSVPRFLRSLAGPAVLAILVAAGTFALGARSLTAQLGVVASVLVAGVTLAEVGRATWLRHRSAHEALPRAFSRLVWRARRRYGGYLVHLGIVLIGLGAIGSTWFQIGHEATLAPGEQLRLGQYTFTYLGKTERQEGTVRTVQAAVGVAAQGPLAGDTVLLAPAKRFHRGWEKQPGTQVAIHTTLPRLDDLYLVLAGWEDDGRAHFQAFVNPLVSLIWAGLALVMGAAVFLLWPETRRVAITTAREAPIARHRSRPDLAGAVRALGRPVGIPLAAGVAGFVVVGAFALTQTGGLRVSGIPAASAASA